MTDYSNGKIYKITCNETDRCYIGSTTKTLTKRFKQHKNHHTSWKNGKCNYITIYKMFDEYGKENCNIELIENYPCDNNSELELREAYFIRKNNCYNKYIPGRTLKEYYKDNKEKYKELSKKYRKDNKEKLKEKYICLCGGKYTKQNQASHFKTKKHEDYEKTQQQIINIHITNLTINN